MHALNNGNSQPSGDSKSPGTPLIAVRNITVRIRDRHILPHTTWEIHDNEHWGLIGPNGAGKTSLAGVLAGRVPYVRGRVFRATPDFQPDHIGYVSFEDHERLVDREERMAMADAFSGTNSGGIRVRDLLRQRAEHLGIPDSDLDRIIARLDISHLVDRSIGRLSTGELRKIMIARAATGTPRLLILDEPFDGLSGTERDRVARLLSDLIRDGLQLVLITHRFHELIPEITHLICLKNGQVVAAGEKETLLTPDLEAHLYRDSSNPVGVDSPGVSGPKREDSRPGSVPIIKMENVSVTYGERTLYRGLDWCMMPEENWCVLGPNGSGKTTLLELVAGDNLQAYANKIYLFGHRRGSGETLWDIKRRIGQVSAELQTRYRKPIRVKDAVLSGFFDSVGLYRNADPGQIRKASRWLRFIGLEDRRDRLFTHLSYGERRSVLLARCMVKSPDLLILDEPCQGLDPERRRWFLSLIDRIGSESATRILYVTHHEDEIPNCITHILELNKTGHCSIRALRA